MFRDTVGPIQHQIRPFARAVQKPLRTLNGAANPLSKTSTGLTKSFGELNKLFNALAYNPPGSAEEGYLFWLGWLNHDTNTLFFTQDAGGPLRHGLVLANCSTIGSAQFAISFTDQFLNTLRQLERRADVRADRRSRSDPLPALANGDTPPTITRILVAIGFALSCFALALFLWIAFGGPLPLKPEGYRFTVPFKEATQLAVQSDVRISGVSVGKVKSINLADNGLADASIEVDSQYAPVPSDTRAILRQKTLLGETYVELTPGNRDGPKLAGGRDAPRGAGLRRGPARRDLPDLQRPHSPGLPGLDAGDCRRSATVRARTSRRRSPSSTRSRSRPTGSCRS